MQDTNIESIGELIVIEHKTLPLLFSEGKASEIVDDIEKKVRSFVPDIGTPKGRKDISSLAYKIARSKTIMDDAGKTLTADWKARAKAIDQERSRIWSRLEALQEEIRKPLTEYENKEKQRKNDHQWELGKFKTIIMIAIVESHATIESLEKGMKETNALFNSRDWEEFTDQAKELYNTTLTALNEKLLNKKIEIETQKREEAERKLKEERDRIEREEAQRIKTEQDRLMLKNHKEIPIEINPLVNLIGKSQFLCDGSIKTISAAEELEKEELEQENPEITMELSEPFYSPIPSAPSHDKPNSKVYVLIEISHQYDSQSQEIFGIYKHKKDCEQALYQFTKTTGTTVNLTIEEHEVIE